MKCVHTHVEVRGQHPGLPELLTSPFYLFNVFMYRDGGMHMPWCAHGGHRTALRASSYQPLGARSVSQWASLQGSPCRDPETTNTCTTAFNCDSDLRPSALPSLTPEPLPCLTPCVFCCCCCSDVMFLSWHVALSQFLSFVSSNLSPVDFLCMWRSRSSAHLSWVGLPSLLMAVLLCWSLLKGPTLAFVC